MAEATLPESLFHQTYWQPHCPIQIHGRICLASSFAAALNSFPESPLQISSQYFVGYLPLVSLASKRKNDPGK
ncbi:hypothetical protein D3C86_1740920 [compost metagenome]